MTPMYYTQVQGQLLVSQRKYCGFVVWTQKERVAHSLYPNKIIKFYRKAVAKIDQFLFARLHPSVTEMVFLQVSNVTNSSNSNPSLLLLPGQRTW